jgi:hypothetical protein
MDFDELKSVWKKANDQERSGYWVSESDVKNMIKKRSKAAIADVIRQLKQKVRMSGIIGGVTILLGVSTAFFAEKEEDFLFDFSNLQYGSLMLIMGICLVFLHFHARLRLRQVRELNQSAAPIKVALVSTKVIFKKIITTGVYSDAVVAPLVITLGTAMSLYRYEAFAFDHRLLIILALAVTTPYLFYQLTKFLMQRRLGHFIAALDMRLEELEALEIDDVEK